jgi:putative serine protease PepD
MGLKPTATALWRVMNAQSSVESSTSADMGGAPPEKPGKGGSAWWVWGLGAVGVLAVGGLIGGLIASVGGSSAAVGVCNTPKVANEVLPSVVTISASKGAKGGIGSGEIIRSDGSIMTNNHVISLAADGGTIQVLFSNGTTAPATLTGRDPASDLAVIKVNEHPSLPVIEMGTSSDLAVGAPVVALGAPLGLTETVTSGIISALDRTIEVPSDNGQTALLASAIQTDAAINPGNSGGALVDCGGKLIGVPSAGAVAPSPGLGGSSGSIGLGFAIPVDVAKRISDELIATGTVTHSYFGLQVAPVPSAATDKMGGTPGLYVAGVVPNSPAADAGLVVGDIITEIDGKSATSPNELEAVTLAKAPGEKVTLTYLRDGKPETTVVTLGAQPPPPPPPAPAP